VLPALTGFGVFDSPSDQEVVRITKLSDADIQARRQSGTLPYLAVLDGEAVGYGWCACRQAQFGSRSIPFHIPPWARYLQDFFTDPHQRGLGIYPRLLQAIIAKERVSANAFWILHQTTNIASSRGIAKAGFKVAATICFLPDRELGMIPVEPMGRTLAGAAMLGLPVVSHAEL